MFLIINKPKGMTSHDVVDKVREITGEKKVGHAGTLDPNATGVLIVGVGRASTKKLGGISKNTTKTYSAEIYLGEERTTHDPEGEVVQEISQKVRASQSTKSSLDDKSDVKSLPDLSKIKRVINSFIGEQEQVPPIHSAVKIKGKKAYELARKGKKVKLRPRKITIHSIKLIKYDYPILEIDCVVSSGTYIRSLARDIGRKLGTGAYLRNLVRVCIGKYCVNEAVSLSELQSPPQGVNWRGWTIDSIEKDGAQI